MPILNTLPTNILDYAIEHTDEALFLTDMEGRLLFVNQKACSSLGYSKEELTNLKVTDVDYHTTVSTWPEMINALKEQKNIMLETMHQRKNGSTFPVEVNITYMVYEDHEYLLGFARNIVERKKQTELIEKQYNEYKTVLQTTLDGYWMVDIHGNLVEVNQSYCDMSGYSTEELLKMHISQIEMIESPEDTKKRIEKIIKNGSDLFETVHRKKDGTVMNVEVSTTFIASDGGKFIALLRDITQRVEYETQLQLASKVFEASADAIIITNKENKIISANRAFEKLSGYTQDEIIGKNPNLISSGWGDKNFYDAMWKDIVEQGIWIGEIWDRNKRGELYAASTSIVSVTDKDGKIVNYIGISHDITKMKEDEKRIKQLAYYDFLTKLPNRKSFEEEVQSSIKSAYRNKQTFAILFLDLDNFKWVNDSLGHLFGDKILLRVSNLISAIITQESIFARLGGDEFVILAPYDDLLKVSQLATAIIESLRYPITIDKHDINVSWSIGISLFPENGKTYDELLKNADTAMYSAKDEGKNTFHYFSEQMNESAKRRLELDTRLRYAVNQNEFYLVYQPKYSCSAKDAIGFEALIRWNDSKLGNVPPDHFIPIAEQSGYIYELGLWVLERALKDLISIKASLSDKQFTMAVNISAKQLQNNRFLEDVKRLLALYEIDGEFLEFEITETSLMKDITRIIPTLVAIKELKITLSIDDFGTGYSSMAYLKKLPIDALKIDREFISELHCDNENRAIVEATLALAKTLGLKTVAEGVEIIEHVTILHELECDIFQGYYYSKPLLLEQLLEFLASDARQLTH